MNLHPLAIDLMITIRDEAKEWIQIPDNTQPGYTVIRRAATYGSGSDDAKQTETVRMERVKNEMASDFIMLEAISAALRKHGVAE